MLKLTWQEWTLVLGVLVLTAYTHLGCSHHSVPVTQEQRPGCPGGVCPSPRKDPIEEAWKKKIIRHGGAEWTG